MKLLTGLVLALFLIFSLHAQAEVISGNSNGSAATQNFDQNGGKAPPPEKEVTSGVPNVTCAFCAAHMYEKCKVGDCMFEDQPILPTTMSMPDAKSKDNKSVQ